MARKKLHDRKDWPAGLIKNGKGYYSFRMPNRYKEPGKYYPDVGLGYDFDIAAMHVENALHELRRRKLGNSYVDRMTTPTSGPRIESTLPKFYLNKYRGHSRAPGINRGITTA